MCPKKIEYIPEDKYDFQKVEQPKERTIRVLNEDVELYEIYIRTFRERIDFCNEQINDYKKDKDN